MNKIYKVIWSKTRNCYVAVAEFVKRNGKGGSVLNRRHIAAALAAVAICAAPAGALANSGGRWDGNDYIGDAPYNVTINEDVNGIVYGRYETDANAGASGATLSIVTGGKANAAFGGRAASGDVTGNKVTMTDGATVVRNVIWIGDLNVSGMLIGGFADTGNVEKNTVELSGGTVNSWLIGGYAEKGEAKENSVTVSGGTVSGMVYGGYSFDGDATNNTVTISGDTVKYDVHGGYSISNRDNATAVDNTVTINGGTFEESVYGGKASSHGGDIVATGNKVIISSGKVLGMVLGGRAQIDYDGTFVIVKDVATTENEVTISGGTIGQIVCGGYSEGTATGNTVTIKGGTTNSVVGGYSSGDAVANKVIISGGTVKEGVCGGQVLSPHSKGNTVANKVIISGGSIENDAKVYGGRSESNSGNATDNTVTIGEKFEGTVAELYGGSSNNGSATGNRVDIAGGSLGGAYGGFSEKGSAAGNQVDIAGGTFGGVFGGFSDSGDATGNRVNITGSKVGAVFGGFSNKVVKYNTVIIGGGTFEEGVYGGFSQPGVVEKNAVTISDGTFENPIQVFGGYSQTKATDNAVNLTGTTTGLDTATLQGYPGGADFNVSHSGNELHIGGTKTYDKNGTATITKGSWQGMDASGKHTNTVAKVANFDSIVLHNVVWGDVPALSAKNMENIGGLDVTDLAFYTHPDNSTVHEHALKDYMVLVHADKNDLTGLKISYLDEGKVKTEALTNQGIHYHTAPHSSTENGVTVDGKEVKRIFLADHNRSVDFFYHITGDKLTVGEVNFIKGGTTRILDGRFDVRNAVIDADGLTFTNASRLKMAPNDEMTIVDAQDAIANKNGSTLQPFATKQLTDSYSFTPADGVIVAAKITGSLRATPKNNGLVYKVNSNQADKLTFGSVDWKDGGSLFKRPAAVTFAGAAVDTSEIHFKNLKELKGNAQMTLVSDFGGSPGRITGTTYKIGTTLEGEGAASLVNGDLIFTTKAQEKMRIQDQTHNTVMGMTAGLAALAGGTEQLSQGMETLMDTSDGDSGKPEEHEEKSAGGIFLSLGGRRERYEPGSHVTSNTWNGVLGIGGKRAVKSGTWQYAAFAEHGRANFTLHSDTGRGDGTSKYTGGGLLAKWQSRHDVYVEGSIRAGRMHDTASDMLYDAATGQSYGYDVHANYIGGHVGLGKVFRYNNGRSLDVYGKYFHMKRDGVSFEAEGHYDLDSVTSSVLRVGARYGATDKKWNWYGGLAYEYEFDGKATGRADGAEIRAASIKGGSVRGELGIRMEATKTSPWKADIRLTGYAGKRRGIGGNVSVAYTF